MVWFDVALECELFLRYYYERQVCLMGKAVTVEKVLYYWATSFGSSTRPKVGYVLRTGSEPVTYEVKIPQTYTALTLPPVPTRYKVGGVLKVEPNKTFVCNLWEGEVIARDYGLRGGSLRGRFIIPDKPVEENIEVYRGVVKTPYISKFGECFKKRRGSFKYKPADIDAYNLALKSLIKSGDIVIGYKLVYTGEGKFKYRAGTTTSYARSGQEFYVSEADMLGILAGDTCVGHICGGNYSLYIDNNGEGYFVSGYNSKTPAVQADDLDCSVYFYERSFMDKNALRKYLTVPANRKEAVI